MSMQLVIIFCVHQRLLGLQISQRSLGLHAVCVFACRASIFCIAINLSCVCPIVGAAKCVAYHLPLKSVFILEAFILVRYSVIRNLVTN